MGHSAPLGEVPGPKAAPNAVMASKARKYGPPHVQIVLADPSGERIAS
ncbi:hypothetical protein [Streptomyces sp. NPDC058657]